jgi:hypothetical protein
MNSDSFAPVIRPRACRDAAGRSAFVGFRCRVGGDRAAAHSRIRATADPWAGLHMGAGILGLGV